MSCPGRCWPVLAARLLAEFGDDRKRYDCAKSRWNYAGTSPITIASGRKSRVLSDLVHDRSDRIEHEIGPIELDEVSAAFGLHQVGPQRCGLESLHLEPSLVLLLVPLGDHDGGDVDPGAAANTC